MLFLTATHEGYTGLEAKYAGRVWVYLVNHWPRAGSGIERIDPLRFVAGCRKRRLNQRPKSAYDFFSVQFVSLFYFVLSPGFLICLLT